MESAISLAIVFLSAVSVAGAFAFDRAPRAFSLVLVLMSVPVLLYVPFFGCFAFLAVAGAGVVGTLAGYEVSKLRTTW